MSMKPKRSDVKSIQPNQLDAWTTPTASKRCEQLQNAVLTTKRLACSVHGS